MVQLINGDNDKTDEGSVDTSSNIDAVRILVKDHSGKTRLALDGGNLKKFPSQCVEMVRIRMDWQIQKELDISHVNGITNI